MYKDGNELAHTFARREDLAAGTDMWLELRKSTTKFGWCIPIEFFAIKFSYLFLQK